MDQEAAVINLLTEMSVSLDDMVVPSNRLTLPWLEETGLLAIKKSKAMSIRLTDMSRMRKTPGLGWLPHSTRLIGLYKESGTGRVCTLSHAGLIDQLGQALWQRVAAEI